MVSEDALLMVSVQDFSMSKSCERAHSLIFQMEQELRGQSEPRASLQHCYLSLCHASFWQIAHTKESIDNVINR